jgi:hypothetical protein
MIDEGELDATDLEDDIMDDDSDDDGMLEMNKFKRYDSVIKENKSLKRKLKFLKENSNKAKRDQSLVEKTLKKLNESNKQLNLLNSKLLYSNRILKEKSLTESKKLYVVKTFDNATSIKESKLIYEMLKDSLVSKPLNTKHKPFASKTTQIVENKKASQPINEDNGMTARWQRIAGIKK